MYCKFIFKIGNLN